MSDISKLPRWAQAHIELLDREIGILNDRIMMLEAKSPGPHYAFSDYFSEAIPLHFPTPYQTARPRVTFSRDVTQRAPRFHALFHVDHDTLEVSGDDRLIVEPIVTNMIRVRYAR